MSRDKDILNRVVKATMGFDVGKIYKRSDIIDIVHKITDITPGSIIPSDYCYNMCNEGIDFLKWPHIFEWTGHGEYKFLGENYAYNGIVLNAQKEIYGYWKNGVFLKK